LKKKTQNYNETEGKPKQKLGQLGDIKCSLKLYNPFNLIQDPREGLNWQNFELVFCHPNWVLERTFGHKKERLLRRKEL